MPRTRDRLVTQPIRYVREVTEVAKETTVKVTDDLDGSPDPEHTNFDFSVDGKSYEIDLSTTNRAKILEALAPFVAVARRATNGTVTPIRRRSSSSAANNGSKAEVRAARAWLQEWGFKVSDRGRIPEEGLQAYRGRQSNGHPAANETYLRATKADHRAETAAAVETEPKPNPVTAPEWVEPVTPENAPTESPEKRNAKELHYAESEADYKLMQKSWREATPGVSTKGRLSTANVARFEHETGVRPPKSKPGKKVS